ncbi:MAG TPA: ABC transporter permease, partial [Pseudomonadales bacterium]|nr:ABC transporter permease [Pseudomonadales bacterium]
MVTLPSQRAEPRLRIALEIAQNQQQALQMSSFFLLPSMLLSGFMFPYEGMPRPAQWVAQIFPLTHFIRIARPG